MKHDHYDLLTNRPCTIIGNGDGRYRWIVFNSDSRPKTRLAKEVVLKADWERDQSKGVEGWKEEARRATANADHWRGLFEKAVHACEVQHKALQWLLVLDQ